MADDRAAAGPFAVPEAADGPVWLRVGTLIDGISPTPVRDAHVVYDPRAIRFVGAAGRLPPPDALRPGQRAPDLDAPDATLLPGLIDAHTHFFLEGGELDPDRRAALLDQPAGALVERARARLDRLVPIGLAGVRDAGDRHGVGLALSRLSRSASAPPVPYVDSPGAAINRRGRYGSFMSEPLEAYASPDDAVAARVAAGAARIKIIPTGIIDFTRGAVTAAPQMTAGEVGAIAAAARARGCQCFAHASGDAGIQCALHGGVDSIEHGFFIRDDQLAYMRDHDIAWVPTFAPVQAQIDHAARAGWDEATVGRLVAIVERHGEALVRAHRLGVRVIAGSDAGSMGVPHGLGLLRELVLMERAGLPAAAVIVSATGASAERFRYREPIGRIAPGFRSRFILASQSPLESVRHLGGPRTIVFDGRVFAGQVFDARVPGGNDGGPTPDGREADHTAGL